MQLIFPLIIFFIALLGICFLINQKIERLLEKIEDIEFDIKNSLSDNVLPHGKPTKPINTRGMTW